MKYKVTVTQGYLPKIIDCDGVTEQDGNIIFYRIERLPFPHEDNIIPVFMIKDYHMIEEENKR